MTIKRALIWAAVSTRPQADEDEKFSIPKQIEDGEAMCRDNGWRVMDTLIVPGHSRDYRTLEELAAAARSSKQHIDAFDRLIKHFRDKDFDVFICRDANRFARKASLLHYIAETIIEDCGALIYSQADNLFVDEEKLPMWATIQGYKVRAENKALMTGRHNGMFKVAERGLPTSSKVLLSHAVVRDEFGHAERLEVDETKRRLWDDVYRLLVNEHSSWRTLEVALTELGHTDETGKPFHRNCIRHVIASPTFWGHSARFHYKLHAPDKRGWGWVYDCSKPAPAGVVIYRDTHPAVYTGDQARRLIAELERPARQRLGNAQPYHSHRYSGLVVCRECGRHLNYAGSPPYVYMGCRTTVDTQATCLNTKKLKESAVEDFARDLQQRLQQGESLQTVLAVEDNHLTVDRARAQIKADIETTIEQSRRLIMKQASVRSTLIHIYDEQLELLGNKLAALDEQLRNLSTEIVYDKETQESAAKEFADLGEGFWELADTEINACLSRMLRYRRMSSYKGQVLGFEDAPKKRTWL